MEFKQIINTLRQKGYRITPQREMLIQIIHDMEGHFLLEQVYEEARGKENGINLATVYRNLDFFERNGVITKIHEGKETWFSLKTHASHFHLICRNCEANIEADLSIIDDLRKVLIDRYGFQAEMDHMAISGYCAHPGCAPAVE